MTQPQTTNQGTDALDNALAHMDNITELNRAIETASDDGEALYEGDLIIEDDLRQRVDEYPLSVEVRNSDWYTPGSDDAGREPDEYRILISTGGPACQITGSLNQYGEPDSAQIEHQDWFKPWTPVETTTEQTDILLWFAGCFYFGDA